MPMGRPAESTPPGTDTPGTPAWLAGTVSWSAYCIRTELPYTSPRTGFSSLLGVWQAVPYLFADCWQLVRNGPARIAHDTSPRDTVDTRSKPYRTYLLLLAFVPMLGLFTSFREVQKLYTVLGALFFPLLAIALLICNTRWINARYKNKPATLLALFGVLALFVWIAVKGIRVV